MHIVCPHCTTSYAVDPASFGTAERPVRCSRCKETWVATPEHVAAIEARAPSMAGADEAAGWNDALQAAGIPTVESPPISSELPQSPDVIVQPGSDGVWTSLVQQDNAPRSDEPSLPNRISRHRTLKPWLLKRLPRLNLTTCCFAMAAMVLAMVIWRVEIVRLLPQTAMFYRLAGLGVNLRGLAFKDVRMSTETVDGKPVLVIEGTIVPQTRKSVELPRLRFSVRDVHDTEIYAWNAVLEQTTLKPGENAWFRSRLASPPPEGRSIVVRFFNRHDIARGEGA
jgi:predicted Zn finger-like uncharacterized protein